MSLRSFNVDNRPRKWTWEEWWDYCKQSNSLTSWMLQADLPEGIGKTLFHVNEPYIEHLEKDFKELDQMYENLLSKNNKEIKNLEARIAELESNTKVTPKRQNQDRLKSYKKVGEFLNSKGASSGIWSELENLLEPNGIFLKQRETITTLREALEFYNQEPIRMENGAILDTGEVARIALKECFGEENE